jgi:hypothetical protein
MWLKDPNFKGYLTARAEAMLGDVQYEALLSLIDKVLGGDLKAIQYYHEITGRYIPATVQTTSSNATDMQNMIVRIIEIIVDEVTDPAEALRIADRLKALVMGNQVAGLLPVGTVIEQPEIAESREMTPEVVELMAKGAGYND